MKYERKRVLLKYFDIFLGTSMVLYTIAVNIMSAAKVAFSLPVIACGIVLIIYHFIKDKLKHMVQTNNRVRKLNNIVKVCICIGIAFFMLLEMAIIIFPKYNKKQSDYVIVLGAGLWQGVYPTETLRNRLGSAIDYYNSHKETEKIVVSGGQGEDEEISEAEAMKSYLVERGIPEEDIILEDKSRNTTQNLKYSREKIEECSGKSIEELNITIVTTEFHALRSNFLAKRCGYKNVTNYSAKTVWYLIPIMYTRESVAIVKSAIFDK